MHSSLWLNLLGWGGSALLIWSVLQAGVLRFRALNLAASAALTAFNAFLGIWPMVAMNLVLCLINLWHLRRLLGERHDEQAYEVIGVAGEDGYLRHLLKVHRDDLLRFQPDLDLSRPADHSFLVLRGDETIGIVLLDVDPDTQTAQIRLDWVSKRFRDRTPGEFVWRRSSVLRDLGIRRVRTSAATVDAYYDRIGFVREDDHWVLKVA